MHAVCRLVRAPHMIFDRIYSAGALGRSLAISTHTAQSALNSGGNMVAFSVGLHRFHGRLERSSARPGGVPRLPQLYDAPNDDNRREHAIGRVDQPCFQRVNFTTLKHTTKYPIDISWY
jgi:hypothetical protein